MAHRVGGFNGAVIKFYVCFLKVYLLPKGAPHRPRILVCCVDDTKVHADLLITGDLNECPSDLKALMAKPGVYYVASLRKASTVHDAANPAFNLTSLSKAAYAITGAARDLVIEGTGLERPPLTKLRDLKGLAAGTLVNVAATITNVTVAPRPVNGRVRMSIELKDSKKSRRATVLDLWVPESEAHATKFEPAQVVVVLRAVLAGDGSDNARALTNRMVTQVFSTGFPDTDIDNLIEPRLRRKLEDVSWEARTPSKTLADAVAMVRTLPPSVPARIEEVEVVIKSVQDDTVYVKQCKAPMGGASQGLCRGIMLFDIGIGGYKCYKAQHGSKYGACPDSTEYRVALAVQELEGGPVFQGVMQNEPVAFYLGEGNEAIITSRLANSTASKDQRAHASRVIAPLARLVNKRAVINGNVTFNRYSSRYTLSIDSLQVCKRGTASAPKEDTSDDDVEILPDARTPVTSGDAEYSVDPISGVESESEAVSTDAGRDNSVDSGDHSEDEADVMETDSAVVESEPIDSDASADDTADESESD